MAETGHDQAFWLFRRLFPPKGLEYMSPEEIAALGKVYKKWQLVALPFVLGYSAATGFAWYSLFRLLGGLAARSHHDAVHVLVPAAIFWAFPSIFLGIISASIPTLVTMKALLGESYVEYMRWTDLHHRYDGWKVFRIMAPLFVFGSSLMVVGGLLTWFEFRQDAVSLNRPWPVRTSTYRYDRVVVVAQIARGYDADGKLVPLPHFAIKFDDGEVLTSREMIKADGGEPDEPIFALVAERSGQPIQRLDQISDLNR